MGMDEHSWAASRYALLVKRLLCRTAAVVALGLETMVNVRFSRILGQGGAMRRAV